MWGWITNGTKFQGVKSKFWNFGGVKSKQPQISGVQFAIYLFYNIYIYREYFMYVYMYICVCGDSFGKLQKKKKKKKISEFQFYP